MRAPVIEHGQIFEMQWGNGGRPRSCEDYTRGYLAGWHECFVMCLQEIEEEARTWG